MIAGRRSHPRRVVYTCLFGYSEQFSDHRYPRDGETDYVCFTDDKTLTSDFWSFRHIEPSGLDPVRTAKQVKILANRFTGEYDESLYLDNTAQLTAPAADVFALMPASGPPMVCFAHPSRTCIYKEAKAVISKQYDSRDVVEKQMAEYRAAGHPPDAGMITGTALLRRHNDPAVTAVMEDWFGEVLRHSYRDQLSFDFVARRRGFVPGKFPDSLLNNGWIKWPSFPGKRLPRAFDDELYLKLNPDVRESGMSAREHYLKRGMAEGRPLV